MIELAIKLIYNVGILFLMIIPGIIMKKCKMSTDGFGKGISNLVLYVAQPALIFLAYVRPYDSKVLLNAAFVLIFSSLAHVVFGVFAFAFFKKAPDKERRMLRFATIFSNAAFMGIPLISAVFGDEATLYASVYNISFNLFLWSLGVHICTANRDYDGDGILDEDIERQHKQTSSIKIALIHPVTIAALIGLIVFFLPIENYIPNIVIDGLAMLKNLVAPLSMVVIGLRLAEIDFKGFFNNKNLYIFLALRHFALPVAIFAVMRVLMLIGLPISIEVVTVVLIMAATPAASSATMFAEKFDCDAAYVSKLVALSTILSVISMPVVSLLLNI